tara:strand:+ start:2806 stop:6096 length:3291 start_codon:yes stop_codon:yes gene_type:complete
MAEEDFLTPSKPVAVETPEFQAFAKAEREREIEAQKPKVSFSEFIGASKEEDWITSYAFQNKESFAPDLNYLKEGLDQAQFDELTKDIPEDHHDFLEETVSFDHAKQMREKVLASLENEKKMQSWGWYGVPLRIGVNMFDPVAATAGVLGGVAAPVVWGAKLSRVGRIVRGAIGGAASNAAIEGYIASESVTRDEYDVMYAAVAGMLLGGGVGAISRGVGNEPELRQAHENLLQEVEGVQKAELEARAKQDLLGEKSVGAAENPFDPPLMERNLRSPEATEKAIENFGEMQKSEFSALRIDMANYLLSSDNPLINGLGRILAEDAVGKRGDNVIESTADLLKTNAFKGKLARFYQTYGVEYKAWAKENNIGFFRRSQSKQRTSFGEQVADAIENPNGIHSPAVKRMAQRNAELYRDILREAKEAGVKGFENIPENLTYFTHRWNKFKFDDLRGKIGDDGIERLLTQGLVNGTTDLTEDAAAQIAKAMNIKIKNDLAGLDSGFSRLFTADSRDTLKQIMKEERFGKEDGGVFRPFSDDELDRLLGLFEQSQTGVPSRAKYRLRFDMETQFEGTNKLTGTREIFSIKDLQERDAEQVFTLYANEMSGRIALAKKGIKSESDFESLINQAKDYAVNEGVGKARQRNRKRIGKEEEIARTIYNMILGRRPPNAPDQDGAFMRVTRLIQDFNFIRLMNQVGFAQFAELGNAVQVGGIRGLIRVVPEFKAMIKRAENGELTDPVLRDIEAFFGTGAERMTNQMIHRLDQLETNSPYGRGILDGIQRTADRAKRFTADISGMAPITLGLERGTSRIVMQTLADMAFSNKSLTLKRMRSLGLGDDEAQLVFDNFKKNAKLENSFLFSTKKLRESNLEQWDPKARDVLGIAIARWTRRAIQQNDLGNLSLFMTKEYGKVLVQFRTFMVVSHAKQLLHNVAMRDMRAFQAMMYSSISAGLAYTAQQNIQMIGLSDKEKRERKEERLSASAIAKATFARSSYAAFIPGGVDTAFDIYGADPFFANYRSSGLDSNFLTGNPSYQILFGATGAENALKTAVRTGLNPDYQMSRGKARSLLTALPFSNAIGIQNAIRIATEDLPTESRVD